MSWLWLRVTVVVAVALVPLMARAEDPPAEGPESAAETARDCVRAWTLSSLRPDERREVYDACVELRDGGASEPTDTVRGVFARAIRRVGAVDWELVTLHELLDASTQDDASPAVSRKDALMERARCSGLLAPLLEQKDVDALPKSLHGDPCKPRNDDATLAGPALVAVLTPSGASPTLFAAEPDPIGAPVLLYRKPRSGADRGWDLWATWVPVGGSETRRAAYYAIRLKRAGWDLPLIKGAQAIEDVGVDLRRIDESCIDLQIAVDRSLADDDERSISPRYHRLYVDGAPALPGVNIVPVLRTTRMVTDARKATEPVRISAVDAAPQRVQTFVRELDPGTHTQAWRAALDVALDDPDARFASQTKCSRVAADLRRPTRVALLELELSASCEQLGVNREPIWEAARDYYEVSQGHGQFVDYRELAATLSSFRRIEDILRDDVSAVGASRGLLDTSKDARAVGAELWRQGIERVVGLRLDCSPDGSASRYTLVGRRLYTSNLLRRDLDDVEGGSFDNALHTLSEPVSLTSDLPAAARRIVRALESRSYLQLVPASTTAGVRQAVKLRIDVTMQFERWQKMSHRGVSMARADPTGDRRLIHAHEMVAEGLQVHAVALTERQGRSVCGLPQRGRSAALDGYMVRAKPLAIGPTRDIHRDRVSKDRRERRSEHRSKRAFRPRVRPRRRNRNRPGDEDMPVPQGQGMHDTITLSHELAVWPKQPGVILLRAAWHECDDACLSRLGNADSPGFLWRSAMEASRPPSTGGADDVVYACVQVAQPSETVWLGVGLGEHFPIDDERRAAGDVASRFPSTGVFRLLFGFDRVLSGRFNATPTVGFHIGYANKASAISALAWQDYAGNPDGTLPELDALDAIRWSRRSAVVGGRFGVTRRGCAAERLVCGPTLRHLVLGGVAYVEGDFGAIDARNVPDDARTFRDDRGDWSFDPDLNIGLSAIAGVSVRGFRIAVTFDPILTSIFDGALKETGASTLSKINYDFGVTVLGGLQIGWDQ